MKAQITGDIKSLKASAKLKLEKLANRRIRPTQLVDRDLAKRVGDIASELGVQIGLLVDRDGRITHVIVGSRQRIYLPELGRFRLNQARLRRLRFIVFWPDGYKFYRRYPARSLWADGGYINDRQVSLDENQGVEVLAPEVPRDLITDLEKLRFDSLLVVALNEDSSIGSSTLVSLEVLTFNRLKVRGLKFQHVDDINKFDFDFLDFVSELESSLVSLHSSSKKTDQELAVLVGVYTSNRQFSRDSMAELQELARTADLNVVDTLVQNRRKLDPKTVIGRGKLEDLMLHCLDLGATLVVFDGELSPGQLRSITNLTELKVIDRSMLILDIFARRAVSSEGRLQVELAQLTYSLPRLTERDSGLSRLTGGIGGRGPGETKLEISRRRARDRISLLQKKIETLSNRRDLRRSRRQERGVPVIAIIGYTNAGKSTLLNALTNSKVLAESKLFATLDPTSRRMRFPNEYEVVFVDTVGFIRDLPEELVTAFKATLEEVGEADLLLHVQDASNSQLVQQLDTVRGTIDSLGYGDKPNLLVLNKIDVLSDIEVRALKNHYEAICVSALNREGFPELIHEIQLRLKDCFAGADPSQFLDRSV